MSGRALDAAGITDPALRASYEACRRLNAASGRTFYLSTLMLPPWKRPSVHALYALGRYVDEIVDEIDPTLSAEDRSRRFSDWSTTFLRDLGAGSSEHPIGRAVVHTLTRWEIPLPHIDDFLTSMRADLTVTSYETFEDLLGYAHGSAIVIGHEMLPILEPVVPLEVAAPYARDLGVAFQLTNFIRDVGEDLDRGRVYLPQEELRAFGVQPQHLASGVVEGPLRNLLIFQVARARELYRSAQHGVRLLHPTSRPCIQTALRLYSAILDAVERADYQVLAVRISISRAKQAQIALPGLLQAVLGRKGSRSGEGVRTSLG
ncbi:MAG TPA: phytoene/squalene synthase family protein [Mycobacteriales bacterium]|nr:phytoene/squalene synthase family protein [Mycobacteriales bacterium]